MPTVNLSTLKGYFNAGDEPTESNFIDVFESVALLHGDNTNHMTGSMTITGSLGVNDSVRVYGAAKTLVCTGSVDFGQTGTHVALSATGSIKNLGGINVQPEILTAAASVTLTVAQAGRQLLIPSTATTDDEYKLPTPTFLGQTYHLAFSGVAIDTDDIIIRATSADDFTFSGGVLDFKTDETGAGLAVIVYPGGDDDKLTITNVQNFDLTFIATTLTNYFVKGYVMSTDTQTAFGDI